MPTPAEVQEVIDEWFTTNAFRISVATLEGMAETDIVAQAMTDPNATTVAWWLEFIDALDVAAYAVLAENIAAAFKRAFSNQSSGIQAGLATQSERIVRDDPEYWAKLLVQFALQRRSRGEA